MYAEKVDQLVAQFQYFALKKIDQSLNEATNKLVKIALRESPNDLGVSVELHSMLGSMLPLHQSALDPPTWIDELRDFISSSILPEDKNRVRQI